MNLVLWATDVVFDLGVREFVLFVATTALVGGLVLGVQWAQGRRKHVTRLDTKPPTDEESSS